jgi:hypothetical protein
VGPGETFVSKAVNAIPGAAPLSDAIAAGVMQARRGLGLDKPGVQLTPEAQNQAAMRGQDIGFPEAPGPGPVDEYRNIRDTRRLRTVVGGNQNPIPGYVGTGTGLGLTLLAPLPKALVPERAKTIGGRLLTGAASGAGYGAFAGLTEGPADLTKGDVGGAVRDTLAGAGTGLVLGGALSGAAELARPVSGAVKSYAIERGRKLLTSGADSLSKNLPVSDEAVQAAFDAGAIRPLGSATKASARLDQVREQLGSVYSQILGQLEQRGVTGPNARALADDLLRKGIEQEYGNLDRALSDEYMNVANDVIKRSELAGARGVAPGRLGLKQAESIKRGLQDKVKYGKFEETPLNNVREDIASTVRQANEDAVAQAGSASPRGSEVRALAESFVPVKRRLGPIIEAANAATRGASREAQRTSGGFGKMVEHAGDTALMAANPAAFLGKAGLGIAGKSITSSEAAAANALAEILAKGATGRSARALTPAELAILQKLAENQDQP